LVGATKESKDNRKSTQNTPQDGQQQANVTELQQQITSLQTKLAQEQNQVVEINNKLLEQTRSNLAPQGVSDLVFYLEHITQKLHKSLVSFQEMMVETNNQNIET